MSISRSPSVFLFLSVILEDKCVFQVMSINKSMSSNKKLLSLVKLVKLFVSCIQKCYNSKNFWASAPEPRWGLHAPRPVPAKHLHSPLAMPLGMDQNVVRPEVPKVKTCLSKALDQSSRGFWYFEHLKLAYRAAQMQSLTQIDGIYHTFCSTSILSTYLFIGP